MVGIRELVRNCKEELKRRGLKRIGYCCKCGDCCRHASGMSFEVDDVYSFKVDRRMHACDLFNKETNECNKPFNHKRWVCKCWPMLPEHIEKFPNCTYKFVRT